MQTIIFGFLQYFVCMAASWPGGKVGQEGSLNHDGITSADLLSNKHSVYSHGLGPSANSSNSARDYDETNSNQ
jgi:hypothetical protein